jgi:hypothetical protein
MNAHNLLFLKARHIFLTSGGTDYSFTSTDKYSTKQLLFESDLSIIKNTDNEYYTCIQILNLKVVC